tara:strand:+ start:1220 stop:1531 length:312 start_codon:yes stop_codon:yes gene_type:complete
MGDLHILAQNGNIKGIRTALKNKKAFLSLDEDLRWSPLRSLFAITAASTFVLLLGLTRFPEFAPKRIKELFPLFGHFYPDKSSLIVSTNNLWVPKSRYGSGIR